MITRLHKTFALLALVLIFASCGAKKTTLHSVTGTPKREFRGAWLPTIFRSEYMGLSRADGRKRLGDRIAILKQIGCNVVLFQVRAEGDAWYLSEYEPWSRFFTGEQGKEPIESWDPLAFAVEECHKLGMELHAWINPYRGASSATATLSPKHLASRHPEWFVTYNKQLMLDPGRPESRRWITRIVGDIVKRYDVDAIHLDDYFYPYPVPGEPFPDDHSFSVYGRPAGYTDATRADWRRMNVNLLIHGLSEEIQRIKPWVKFGISPFGIYRNSKVDPNGSATNGLQNYDDLYADILLWVNQGWIDYMVPQVYWNIGYKAADYEVLVKWWSSKLMGQNTQLYIGQDVKRTMDSNQLEIKLKLARANALGNVFWPGDELARNYKGVSEMLGGEYQRTPALLPIQTPRLGKTQAPRPLDVVIEDRNEDGHIIMWEDAHVTGDPESAFYYVVYAFPKGYKVSTDRPDCIISISSKPQCKLPEFDGKQKYTILVTAVNRFWQESKPYKLKTKL